MKLVDQDQFGERGNCFAACMASIFELPLADVPGCHGQGWQMALGEFLRDRGLIYAEVPRGNLIATATDVICSPEKKAMPGRTLGWQPLMYGVWPLVILVGPSYRGAFDHAVVGETNGYGVRVLHDPHPSRDGLPYVHSIGMFVKIDPVRN